MLKPLQIPPHTLSSPQLSALSSHSCQISPPLFVFKADIRPLTINDLTNAIATLCLASFYFLLISNGDVENIAGFDGVLAVGAGYGGEAKFQAA